MYNKLIKQAAFFGLLLLAFDTLARKMYWYFRIPRIDMVAHTIGGIFTALIVAALLYRLGKTFNNTKTIVLAFVITILLGIVWEYYEYIVYLFARQSQFINTTNAFSDVCFDALGGVIGIVLVIIENKRYNRSNG